MKLLSRGWSGTLAELAARAKHNLLICSPYMGKGGTELIARQVSESFIDTGTLLILTDLSPMNICQSSTDLEAVITLVERVRHAAVRHLPSLHAKVYVADDALAIVTSGNLTTGGLYHNYESGFEVSDPTLVGEIRRQMTQYASLGTLVPYECLGSYGQMARALRKSFKEAYGIASQTARREFDRRYQEAEDELVRLRLGGETVHAVFTRTVEYLLRQHGPLRTQQIHGHVRSTHPDLCDDSVDRVIGGKHFGKKWKHAVRTAQVQLRRSGKIINRGGVWRIADE